MLDRQLALAGLVTLCTVGAVLAAGGAPSLAELGPRVAKLPASARAAGQSWLDAVKSEQAAGHPKVSVRRATELGADLANILDGATPGTSQAWGGLVSAAQDLLPIDDLHNVEMVEAGVLCGGSEPSEDAIALLKRKGFHSVVNLRKEDNSEAPLVKAAGMTALYIPVVDQHAPTTEQAQQFVDFMKDASHHPVFVHCHEGVGRTHTFIAVWRVATGASATDAIAEGQTWGLSVREQINFVKSFSPR